MTGVSRERSDEHPRAPQQDARKLRVLHLITGLETGGAEVMLANLASAMSSGFHNIVVSMISEGAMGRPMREAGVPILDLGMSRGRASPSAFVRLIRILRQQRPDVLQTWLYHADLLGALAAPFSPGTRLIWNLRCSDLDFERYRRLTHLVVRLQARLSGRPCAVVVNSEAGLEAHKRIGFHPRRWIIVPNGFDLDRFRPDPSARARLGAELGLAPTVRLVGMTARVDPQKDHGTFLEAAARVALAQPDVRFALIGTGTDTDLALGNHLNRLGLDRQVLRLGLREDLDQLIPALDVAVLSSAFGEGFPNVLGEAMAAGVPCVATDVGDAAHILGDTGLIVPPRDPAKLADAIMRLLSLPEGQRQELGRAARARVAERYALTGIVSQYEELYREVASYPADRAFRPGSPGGQFSCQAALSSDRP